MPGKIFVVPIIIIIFMSGCLTNAEKKTDIQGHRGCRGLMPENTIPGFIKAIELGVTTLEMDVVISKDNKVVVSHDPFLSHEICLTPDGKEISEEDEKSYNLFQMTYEEIEKCDCGTKMHPRFPEQEKLAAHKPLLSEVIDAVEKAIKGYVETLHATSLHTLRPVRYNIETKCAPEGDGIFHPKPEEFVGLLLKVLKEKDILDRTIIQSFDVRTLQIIKGKHPNITLALLVENMHSPEENIKNLGFVPDVYSPYYLLVNEDLIKYARENNMKVIPWTIDDKEDMKKLLELGVDGIITDYPDRAMEVVK